MKAVIKGQNFGFADKSLIVSKSVGIYECSFVFDSSWDGWDKTAVFEGSGVIKDAVISDGKAQIPWEVLRNDDWLTVGVFGTQGAKRRPTIWGEKVFVHLGTPDGDASEEPTPSIYAQILEVANEAKEIAEGVQTEWESVSAEAETLPSGSEATAEFSDGVFTFGIPKGERGQQGEQGERGETGADGFSPTVETIGIITPQVGTRVTITDAEGSHSFDVFDGQKGEDGNGIDRITRNTYDGITYTYTLYMTDGTTFSFSVSNGIGISNAVLNADYTLTLTYTDGTTYTTPSIRGAKGDEGETGATPDFSIGTVTTLNPNESATASISGTAEEPILNLGIPRGQTGTSDFASYLPTDTANGTIASFTDGAEDIPVEDLKVTLEPIQDLNGQSNPYPAGGGVNILPPMVDGTYEGNGVKAVVKDGIATLSGTTTSSGNALIIPLTEPITAPNSFYYHCMNSVANGSFAPAIENSANTSQNVSLACSPANRISGNYTNKGGQTYDRIRFYISNGITISGTYAPMFCLTDTPQSKYIPYENLCPISGRNSVDLVRCGKNLLDPQTIVIGKYYNNTLTEITNVDKAHSGIIKVKPSTSYCLNGFGGGSYYAILALDADKNPLPNWYGGASKTAPFVATLPSTAHYVVLNFNADQVNTIAFYESATVDGYIEYQGNTYPISLGSTVYGCQLEIVSGALTVDGVLDTTRLENGNIVSDYYYLASNGATVIGDNVRLQFNRKSQQDGLNISSNTYANKMCNMAPHYFSYASDTVHWYLNNQIYVYLPKTLVGETLASAIAYLTDHPLEVYLEFATPQTITLTPTEVTTLLGDNNIFTTDENGTVEVTYRADIQRYVDKKISALASL